MVHRRLIDVQLEVAVEVRPKTSLAIYGVVVCVVTPTPKRVEITHEVRGGRTRDDRGKPVGVGRDVGRALPAVRVAMERDPIWVDVSHLDHRVYCKLDRLKHVLV